MQTMQLELPSTFQALVKDFRLVAIGEPEALAEITLAADTLAGYRMLSLPEYVEWKENLTGRKP